MTKLDAEVKFAWDHGEDFWLVDELTSAYRHELRVRDLDMIDKLLVVSQGAAHAGQRRCS